MKKLLAPAIFLAFTFLSLAFFDQKKGLEKGKINAPDIDFNYNQRAFGLGFIPKNAWLRAAQQAAELRKNSVFDRGAGWQLEGPTNLGGRISAMAVHPSDPQTIFIGAAAGGVFKSTDGGASFSPIFDDALSLSIGDLAVAPSNKNVVFVGTGEANGGGGSMNYDAVGMYRSQNGGQTWQHIGLETVGTIGKVAVSPTNPNRVWVAAMGDLFGNDADRGVFKTTDGGQTWQKAFFQNDSTGCIDLALHPTNENVVLAAFFERVRRPDRRQYFGPSSGIFRTADGGATWAKVGDNLFGGPKIGRIGLAASASQPGTFYAVVSNETGGLKGFYRSTDGGATWQLRFSGQMPGNFYSSYGWWFGKIWVDPSNSERVFAAGIELFESKNGGQTWSVVANAADVHADHHALWIDPSNTQKIYNGNDGGFYKTSDGGQLWEKNDGLPISQFYAMTIDPSAPERLYGGTQDNGTWRTLTGATDDWEQIFGGDGFVAQVDPTDGDVIFVEYQYGELARSTDGCFSFESISDGILGRKNWHTPYVLHPTESEKLFFGTSSLWFSENRGDSWTEISPDLSNGQPGNLVFGTITTISVSKIDPEIIWCGTDDGNVWVKNGATAAWQKASATLPVRWVTRVTASVFDEKRAFATFSGYRWDEDLPRVFRTDDGGATWQNISAGLPDAPANDILEDPASPDRLWLATDVGVFFSENGGQNWSASPAGLPISPVQDLTISNGRIYAATFGRSIFSLGLDAVSTRPVSSETAILNVFPNPVSAAATIQLSLFEPKTGTLEIVDFTGKSIQKWPKQRFEKGKTELSFDGSGWPTGAFSVVFRGEKGGVFSRRFLKN